MEEEHQYNSPWNIAAAFELDMSFTARQIADMLDEYEKDNQTGMNVKSVAEEIYFYSSGYPVLVSAICKTMDEKLSNPMIVTKAKSIWTTEGVKEAVKIILKTKNPLFDSMIKHVNVQIANRIFETRLYNYFLSEEELTSTMSIWQNRTKINLLKKINSTWN